MLIEKEEEANNDDRTMKAFEMIDKTGVVTTAALGRQTQEAQFKAICSCILRLRAA